jgi:hypothetical protein
VLPLRNRPGEWNLKSRIVHWPDAVLGGAARWKKLRRAHVRSAKRDRAVAEDRQQNSSQKRDRHTAEPLDVPILVSVRTVEASGEETELSFHTIIAITASEAVQRLRLQPGEAKNRGALLKTLANSLAAQFRSAAEKHGGGRVKRISGKIAPEVFDRIIEEMAQQGLVVQTESPKYVRQKIRYWRLADPAE